MFITVLLIKDESWKHPHGHPVIKDKENVVYWYNGILFGHKKGMKFWYSKGQTNMIPLYEMSWVGKSLEIEIKLVVVRVCGEEGMRSDG